MVLSDICAIHSSILSSGIRTSAFQGPLAVKYISTVPYSGILFIACILYGHMGSTTWVIRDAAKPQRVWKSERANNRFKYSNIFSGRPRKLDLTARAISGSRVKGKMTMQIDMATSTRNNWMSLIEIDTWHDITKWFLGHRKSIANGTIQALEISKYSQGASHTRQWGLMVVNNDSRLLIL